jgi:hypothetical protein
MHHGATLRFARTYRNARLRNVIETPGAKLTIAKTPSPLISSVLSLQEAAWRRYGVILVATPKLESSAANAMVASANRRCGSWSR